MATILPIIQDKCSIISVKVKSPGANWNIIEDIRRQSNDIVCTIVGLAFYFNTISTIKTKTDVLPAVTYWLAFYSSDGNFVSTLPVHQAFLQSNLEINAKQIQHEQEIMSALYVVVKDHKDEFLQNKLTRGEQVVKLHFLDSSLLINNEHFIQTLIVSGLKFDVSGIETTTRQQAQAGTRTVNLVVTKPITDSQFVLVLNQIDIVMHKLDYALFEGEIYRKNELATYSYLPVCSVKAFLFELASNPKLRDGIITNLYKLEKIMTEESCSLVKHLKIDYNLIEILNGWCFYIIDRIFVKPGKSLELIPRAFVEYDIDTVPQPGYFKEILENSLDSQQIALFCERFLRLLNHRTKPHKDPVLCLFGEPNSGKTSLFAPIRKIIPPKRIALITKQAAFNKSLIDEKTEIIFLDEAEPSILKLDDWKILTQGGIIAPDRKFKTARPFDLKCPIFITCQQEMDFGREHNPAMDERLCKFRFKTLPVTSSKPLIDVQQILANNAMHCILWATEMAKTLDIKHAIFTQKGQKRNGRITFF